MQTLTIAQARQLVSTVKGYPYEALLLLALATGMRRSELLGLPWQAINFEQRVLVVRHVVGSSSQDKARENDPIAHTASLKTTNSERILALSPLVLDALKRHQADQMLARAASGSWRDLDLVFCTTDGALFHLERDMLLPFQALLDAAGLSSLRFHCLRQSVTVFLFNLGIHPRIIQQILGLAHGIFSQALPSPVSLALQRDALERLSRLLEGQDEDLTEETMKAEDHRRQDGKENDLPEGKRSFDGTDI